MPAPVWDKTFSFVHNELNLMRQRSLIHTINVNIDTTAESQNRTDFSACFLHSRLRTETVLTLGPSTGAGFVLIRLEASKGGFTDCGVVVGGGCVVIGRRPPSWNKKPQWMHFSFIKTGISTFFFITAYFICI